MINQDGPLIDLHCHLGGKLQLASTPDHDKRHGIALLSDTLRIG